MRTSIIFMLAIAMVASKPQIYQPQHQEQPTPYEFHYEVDNAQTHTHYGRSENGDQSGRVSGNYYVLLPDGRLMSVDYQVDGQSGFVPKISYQAGSGNPQHEQPNRVRY